MSDFHRVRRLPPYVFEQVNKLKAKARAGGADIIDLGMGNPDLPAPRHVIDKLVETVGKPRTDRYSASKGIAGLRRAQAAYYARRFGVKLDPGDAGRRDPRLEGRLRQHGAGDHRAGRRGAGAQSVLSDPRLRLPDGGRRDPLRAVRAVAGLLRRARARDHPFDPETDRGRRLLPVQPDGDGRLARLLQGPRPVRPQARDLRAVRRRLRRGLFRGRAAAVGPSGAGRVRRRGRVLLDVEDLLDGGLADRLRGRQRAACSRRWRG